MPGAASPLLGGPFPRLRPASDVGFDPGAIARRLRGILPGSGLLTRAPRTRDAVAELARAHREVHPHADIGSLRAAYRVADEMHRGQMRKSGDPYITHPLAVAVLLARLGMDTTTLVAALLHDTVEDTSYTLGRLREDFGDEVAHLVDGVTKFDKLHLGDAAEAETIRKMLVAAGRDVRVLVIKLADRLHNMQTLDARSPASRARIARATRDVLVPLCDRLGIQLLKRELEDSVLAHLEPEWYSRIHRHVTQRRGREAYLRQVIAMLTVELRRGDVRGTVHERPRHYYSIWRDTVDGGHAEPHDPPRVVVVVSGCPTDCYAALGVVHGLWRPVPGRFKDFVASPKNNLYRSLHTTVLGPEQQPLEVLIRTESMHRSVEYGIVARYRFPTHDPGRVPGEDLDWLRRMLDWQDIAADPEEFLESLRCDLAEGRIEVLTPDGRRVVLPDDATPVDLAYTLNAETGHRLIGARLNGRLIPLSARLRDGDLVEILTEDDQPVPRGPDRNWLRFVRTPQARLQIHQWFSDHDQAALSLSEKVRRGRAALRAALRRHDRALAREHPLVRLAVRLGYPDPDTMFVAIDDCRLDPEHVADLLIDEVDRPQTDGVAG
ncbi:MAG TPA: HD domain-containing protein [Micromonosporaceae bacterium]